MDGSTDGVLEASQELGVRGLAQCCVKVWDRRGVVVLFVSVRVRHVLRYPVGGLCCSGYRKQVLQVAVVGGV